MSACKYLVFLLTPTTETFLVCCRVTLVQNFFFIQEKIRLKYKISYEVDGSSTTETGEVDSFPSVLQG